MRTAKLAVAATGLVLAAALLAGCGGDPIEAGTGGDGKSTASAKPKSPPSNAPTEDSKFPDREVSSVAQDWLDASNTAMKTLDPAPFLVLSDKSCSNCERYARHLRKTKKNGGRNEGDYIEVTQGVSAPKVKGDTAKVTLTVKRGDWRYVSETGAKPQTYKASRYDIVFDLKKVEGKWIVTEEVPEVVE